MKQTITIFKYELLASFDIQLIRLPIGAEILSCDAQQDKPMIWVRIPDASESLTELRHILVLPTGQSWLKDGYDFKFIGTIIMSDGSFVVHAFEAIPK